jgi:hypothetical protein
MNPSAKSDKGTRTPEDLLELIEAKGLPTGPLRQRAWVMRARNGV